MERSFPITVTEVVESGAVKGGLHPFSFHTDRSAALGCLEKVGLRDLGNRLVGELSGGQFQRLLIARCLAIQPKMLLLDEPTSSVDPQNREHIYRLLDGFRKEGMTIVLVTHDLVKRLDAAGYKGSAIVGRYYQLLEEKGVKRVRNWNISK